MINRIALLTVLTASILFNLSALHAQDDVTIEAIPVSDNIYMLTGNGGNIGLFLGNDGTFLIDDQFAPLTDKILAAIKSVGGDTPRFLINTHFHGDHTGGNENLGKAGTLIISHDNVRRRLVNGSYIETFGMNAPPADKVALPVITFSKDMHFHINGEAVRAIHVASAHTDGDSFIHFKNANVVHAGDVFFNGFYPFIDIDNGGSVRGTIAAVDVILAITDSNSKIIPGHGPLGDKAQLQAYRDMLDTAYTRLLKLKNDGVSLEDAIAQEPLKDLEATWGGGFFKGDKWISIIYPGVY
ncbi:MAG: MBL fold metallo-hydrolase [Gammaproteobacteria bacterium]|nr:MAG: MBL fold metallo-hydrolase [Gammaproteobacteria bacterium]